MEFKPQFYGLSEKCKNARKNVFFNQIVELTAKIESSLSNSKICYFLKVPIPIMHREFSRIISRKPEYVESVCNEINDSFLFVCRRWMINQ